MGFSFHTWHKTYQNISCQHYKSNKNSEETYTNTTSYDVG